MPADQQVVGPAVHRHPAARQAELGAPAFQVVDHGVLLARDRRISTSSTRSRCTDAARSSTCSADTDVTPRPLRRSPRRGWPIAVLHAPRPASTSDGCRFSEVVTGVDQQPTAQASPRHALLQVEVALLRRAVLHELHRHEAADRAHVADGRIPIHQRSERLQAARPPAPARSPGPARARTRRGSRAPRRRRPAATTTWSPWRRRRSPSSARCRAPRRSASRRRPSTCPAPSGRAPRPSVPPRTCGPCDRTRSSPRRRTAGSRTRGTDRRAPTRTRPGGATHPPDPMTGSITNPATSRGSTA